MITDKLIDLGIRVPGTGQHRIVCPQCAPTRKKRFLKDLSVTVDQNGAAFLCFHCGWKGGVGVNGGTKAYQKPCYSPDTKLDPKALSYFEGRGIPESVLTRNKISYQQKWMHGDEKEVGVVCFPYYRDGEILNIKYRSGTKSFRFEKGAELCLYGVDDINPACLVVVEGEIDKLSVETAGINSCVSIPNGAPPITAKNFEKHFDYLNCVDLSKISKFIIAVDNDEPGRALKYELVRRLGPEKCWIAEFPENCKDANDVLVKHGKELLKKLIENPKPFPIAGIVEASELQDNVIDIYNNGYQPGESPGSPMLEQNYTVKPGQITIVTGIPSHGKSAFVDWVAYSLAQNSEWRFAVCSPENFPVSEHIIKYVELNTGKPFWGPGKVSESDIKSSMVWIQDHFTFISPEDDVDDWTVEGILKLAKSLVLRKGIKGLILDPWNEFDHSRSNGLSETEHISRCLSKIRRFARTHGVHVWVVAHPTKLKKADATAKQPMPDLYDINGSAAFYNKADMGVVVWRDTSQQNSPVVIDVKKVRFKRCGRVGAVDMHYDLRTNRYSDSYDERESMV